MNARRDSQATVRGATIEARNVRRALPHLICAVVAFLLPIAAVAQSFDCGQARDAVEKAICSSSRLRQLDSELAKSYAAALQRDAAQADAVRQAQRNWTKLRSACMAGTRPAASSPEQCLAEAYAARLAALAPAHPSPGAPSSPVAATPSLAATPSPAATAATGSPSAPGPSLPAQSGPPGGSGPGNAAAQTFAQIRPVTGLPAMPPGVATLERDRFPSAGETDVLLHVTTAGRFAIRATSPTGTALELVDMLSGPGDRTGWPGKQDGRIDALLDVGTYKLRSFGDPAAAGDTSLSVAAFSEGGPPQLAPGYQPVAIALSDLKFQAFWLVVGDADVTTRIEAAGRSLAALKLWRDGRDLVAVPETVRILMPTPAHPLTDIVLAGRLPAGTYLIIAYGGPQLPWSDGATDEPLYVRTGRSTDLLAGGASGQVGLFGSELFDVPPDAAQALLALPQPAEAHLGMIGADPDVAGVAVADLAKQDRSGVVLAELPTKLPTGNLPTGPSGGRILSLEASPGQQFSLRPMVAGGGFPPSRPGRYWLGVAEPMNGGDEAPAAAIFTRIQNDARGTPGGQPEVLATPGVPTIGPGKAWRSRFNLRGETALLFQATDAVTVAVHAEGPPVTPIITTIEGAVLNAMGDGRTARSWTLSAGWYTLVLPANRNAIGILDLTLGPPGLIPAEPTPPGPPAPILAVGELDIDATSQIDVATNRVPDGPATLLSRAIPVELADGPLTQTLAAGAPLNVTVHAKRAGMLVVRDISGGAPLQTSPIGADTTAPVAVPAADHPRTLAVALLPPPAPVSPNPAATPNLTALRDGQPVFLDLARDQQADFAMTVGQGGLYRVETLGRLKTEGSIGTSFIPTLGEASANGVGNNMLLQRFLRAGRYRLQVTAHDSSGRLGVSASATPLAEGAGLLPGGSVRATLLPGSGVGFPIHIAVSGRYHLDILGDGRTFQARLEDAGGWPMLAAGDLSAVDQDLWPGDYRLIVQPPAVQARVVARLRRIEPVVALSGHGPHVLPFDAPQSLEWREPPGRDDPRAPDIWRFALAGPAKVTLSILGDGMAAALRTATADAAAQPLLRLQAGTPQTIDLPTGTWQVAASSLGRNDRLAYKISLHADELQPDTPRDVTLPVELPVAVAAARVVTLTSFGKVPVRAELRDEAGNVVAGAAGRTDDWNVALSRFLPAGRYRLALTPLVPPPGRAAPDTSDSTDNASNDSSSNDSSSNDSSSNDNSSNDNASNDNVSNDNASNDNASNNDAGSNNSSDNNDSSSSDADNQQSRDNSGRDQTSTDQSDQSDAGEQTSKQPTHTEVTLFLPPDSPDLALAEAGSMQLPGHGIEHVTLPTPPNASLLVAAAEAPVELILALERQGTDGAWHTVGQDQGLAPVLGIPVGNAAAAWRLSVWTVDGGTVPIRIAARAVTATPAPVGTVPLAPVALDGITRHWHAALVADPGAVTLHLSEPDPALLATSMPEQPAEHPADGTIVAQSDAVWVMAPDAVAPHFAVVQAGAEMTVGVPAGGRATLPVPAAPAASTLCAYVAASGLGQPGLDAGRGMDAALGSAFALCGSTTLRAWNAGGSTALRLRLRRYDLAVLPEAAVDQAFAATVPPHAALPIRLAAGTKRLEVSLATHGALVAGWRTQDAVTVWAGDTALSRSQIGAWTDALIVNTGEDPAPVALTVSAAEPLSLGSGGMYRRFFGAGGSFTLPLAAKPGQRLILAGDATASVHRPDGQIRLGRVIPLDGPATVVVSHGAGPLALWIEGPGVSPWPDTTPRDVSLPQRLTLEQEAMTLRLRPGAPTLLRLASSSPVILALGSEPPVLFGKGAALARYLPSGLTTLRLLSPQDGPLSGSLELSGSPVIEVGEGLGAPVAIPPGGAAVFGFSVTAAGPVGLGVRADPDRVSVRLLNEHGETLQSGVSMLRQLQPGRFLLEASVPPDAPTTLARPAVLGIVPHPNPPPPDVVRGLLLAAGLAPPNGAR